MRALFFTGLGGLLAVGVLAVALPGGLGLFGDDPEPADVAPPEPEPTPEPAVLPAGPKLDVAPVAPKGADDGEVVEVIEDPEPKVEPGREQDTKPEPAAEVTEPAVVVALAEDALANARWTDPPEQSLAFHLSKLQLLAPGDESLARLRKEAAETLSPQGDKALSRKKWSEAVVAYRNLRSIWPDHAPAKEGLVAALSGQAKVLRRIKDYEGALASADEWLNVEPNDFEALMLRGDMLYALARFEEAKDAYRLARKEKPRSKVAKKKLFKAASKARRAKRAAG